MTITLVDVQSSLLKKLISSTDIISLLDDPDEIREINWVGSKFTYPNIRIRVNEFQRKDADCNIFMANATIAIFSENTSSMRANTIASAVYNFLDKSTINDGTIRTVTRIKAIQYGAERVEESSIWRSEVSLSFQVT